MKEIKKWLMFGLVLLIGLGLVACSSDDKEEKVTLEAEENGVVVKITYEAKEDKVTKQTADNKIPYESLGVTTEDQAKELLAEAVDSYQGIEGVTHNMVYKDDHVMETLSIDYDKADPEEVSALVGTMFEGDISEGISLEGSVELLEDQGFKVVE